MILTHLKKTYCGNIGFEFSHIPNSAERRWFAQLVESFDKKQIDFKGRSKLFSLLTKSEVFDHFMAKKFPQVKRFKKLMEGMD